MEKVEASKSSAHDDQQVCASSGNLPPLWAHLAHSAPLATGPLVAPGYVLHERRHSQQRQRILAANESGAHARLQFFISTHRSFVVVLGGWKRRASFTGWHPSVRLPLSKPRFRFRSWRNSRGVLEEENERPGAKIKTGQGCWRCVGKARKNGKKEGNVTSNVKVA